MHLFTWQDVPLKSTGDTRHKIIIKPLMRHWCGSGLIWIPKETILNNRRHLNWCYSKDALSRWFCKSLNPQVWEVPEWEKYLFSVPNTLSETKICNFHYYLDEGHLCHLYMGVSPGPKFVCCNEVSLYQGSNSYICKYYFCCCCCCGFFNNLFIKHHLT